MRRPSLCEACATVTERSSPHGERITEKYAAFICDSEAKHPLLSWEIADWEDTPPLRILHYRGKRRNGPDQKGTYKELFSVTLESKGGQWP